MVCVCGYGEVSIDVIFTLNLYTVIVSDLSYTFVSEYNLVLQRVEISPTSGIYFSVHNWRFRMPPIAHVEKCVLLVRLRNERNLNNNIHRLVKGAVRL